MMGRIQTDEEGGVGRVRLREWGDDRHRIGKRSVSKKWEWGKGPFRDQWEKEPCAKRDVQTSLGNLDSVL